MLPVSSLTTTAMASVACAIPSAERWRSPKWRGRSVSCDTGRMQPADIILIPAIIIAPSCSGLFVKKMFSISRVLIFASIMSPVR